MKKPIFILSMTLCLVILLSFGVSGAILNTSDLLLYYNMDEGDGIVVTDSSGNNLNADINDADYNFGRNGTGVEIAEITSRVSITNDLLDRDLNNTGMIHMMWIYLYDNSTQQYFLEKPNSFRFFWTGTLLAITINGKTDSSNTFATTLPEKEWIQIAAVYNQTHMILIKDNVTLNVDDTSGGSYTNNTNILYYGHDDGRSFLVKGIIDEIAWYNSSNDYISRVDEHFNLGFTSNTDNHTLDWYYYPWCTFDGENSSSIECSYYSQLRTNYSFKCNGFTKEDLSFNNSRSSINIGGGFAENTSISCNATIGDVSGSNIVYNLTTRTKCDTCGRYKFVVFSDSAADIFQGDNVETFIPLIESHNPAFSMCVGDCYGIANTNSVLGDLKNLSDTWNNSLKNGLNYFWVVGNHETTATTFSLNMARRYYNNPHNGQTNTVSRADETSYSFNYSSSLIVVINSEDNLPGNNPNLNGTQLAYVNSTLQNSDKDWKWVFTHDAHFIDVDEVRSNNASLYTMFNETNATSVAAGINNICHNTSDKFRDIEFTVSPIGDNAQSTINCLGDVAISKQAFAIIDVFNSTFVNITWYNITNEVIYNFSITRDVSAVGDTTNPTFALFQNNASATVTGTGSTVNFSIDLADNVQLNIYRFAHNQTGTLTNGSDVAISGTSLSVTEELTITLRTGENICGQFWFNDTSNNENQTGLSCFTVESTTPTISSILVSVIDHTSATVSWTTNQLSNTTVNYGTTAGSLDLISETDDSDTSHSRTLTSLDRVTEYFFTVTSCDASGNCITSSEDSFDTTTVSLGSASPVSKTILRDVLGVFIALAIILGLAFPILNINNLNWGVKEWLTYFIVSLITVILLTILLQEVFIATV